MRLGPLLALLSLGIASAVSYGQTGMVCPPPPSTLSSRPCEGFHYHLQLYRPDTRKFLDVTALEPFANQAACDRAREGHIRRNLAVVDYLKRVKGDERYEPDRVGPCHCDMTREKTSAAYLGEANRTMQLRSAEDVRLRVRERLLDSGLTSDSELIRGLIAQPARLPLLSAPKLAPLPPVPAAANGANSGDDLASTRLTETTKPLPPALDLPLVEVVVAQEPPAAPQVAEETPAPSIGTVENTPLTSAQPAPEVPIATSTAEAAAQEAAESFIDYETKRIDNVLQASSVISDATVKSKIFEAALQRTQLLSNLRALIEGSGVRSRLATEARAAQSEEERLAFVRKIFGDSVAKAWAPNDAADVVIDPMPEVDSEPERVLRDMIGTYSAQQKKRALYMLLARTQPTNEQQLWLITVVDSFIR